MNDKDLMPFGEHKGKPLEQVPAGYLLFIEKQEWFKHEGLKAYIEDNRAVLEMQQKQERKDYFRQQKQLRR